MPPKPIFQRTLYILIGIVGGAIFISQILDGISNALTLITFSIALWTTMISIVLYFMLKLLFRKRLIKWRTADGQLVKILKLGAGIKWHTIGVLILFWGAVIYNESNGTSMTFAVKVVKPIFDTADSRFKILVLPFAKECDYEGVAYDIGNVICKRLEMLNKQDTLNLVTYYFSDSLDFKNFTERQADSLMRYHHANQIIYGYYSFRHCEASDSDKICFNYMTDVNKWKLGKKQFNTNYEMIDIAGIQPIRNGVGQEDIDYVIHTVSGISAIKEDQFPKAIRQFQKIKNFESYNYVQFQIGFCYMSMNEYTMARIAYEKSIKLDSTLVDTWYNLGNSLMMLKEYAKAKEAFENALARDPGFGLAWSGLGGTYFAIGNIPKAKEACEKAVAIDSNSFNALYNLATFYSSLYDSVIRARSTFERAVKISNVDSISLGRAYRSLGAIYKKTNEPIKANEAFKNALEVGPKDTSLLKELGTAFNELGQFKYAQVCFTRLVKVKSDRYEWWYGLAIAYDGLKDYNRAGLCYNRSIYLNPKFALAWNGLAGLHLAFKDSSKAFECYKKAVESNSPDYFIWGNLGSMYLDYKKDNKQAIRCFEKAYKIMPTLQVTINLARLNNSERNRPRTLHYLQISVQMDTTLKSYLRTDTAFKWLSRDKKFQQMAK